MFVQSSTLTHRQIVDAFLNDTDVNTLSFQAQSLIAQLFDVRINVRSIGVENDDGQLPTFLTSVRQ